MQDITPPPKLNSGYDTGPTAGNVPLKKPDSASSLTQLTDNPISTDSRTMAQFASEAEMDKILEDVNKKVKSSQSHDSPKKGLLRFLRKNQALSPETHNKLPEMAPKRSHRSVYIIVVAAIVSLSLVGFAFAAFAGNNVDQTSTSSNQGNPAASSNTSLKAEDLDQLSNDIENQINTLKEAQDFKPEVLNDTSLGL